MAMGPDDVTKYTVKVTNTGKVAGDEVVFAYMKPTTATSDGNSNTPVENKRLFAFERVGLEAGASTTLTFEVTAATHLSMTDQDGHTVLRSGDFDIVFSRGHSEELDLSIRIRLDINEPEQHNTIR